MKGTAVNHKTRKSKGERLGWTSKGGERLQLEERLKVSVEVKKSTRTNSSTHYLIP
jgi:hypothetical protein